MFSRKIVALGVCLAIAGCADAPMPTESRVGVVAHDAHYDVSVPLSKVVLQVPRDGLYPVRPTGEGSTGSPRYFQLHVERGLTISGWIEPARLYEPLDLARDLAKLAGTPLGRPLNVESLRVGDFDAVAYDLAVAPGVTAVNVRASWHDDDTWIDLHLSDAGDPASAASLRAEVVAALRGLVVLRKP